MREKEKEKAFTEIEKNVLIHLFFKKKEAPFDSHVIEGETNASPRLIALCMLSAHQLEKPGNVLPPLSGTAGFEPQPPGRRACAPIN